MREVCQNLLLRLIVCIRASGEIKVGIPTSRIRGITIRGEITRCHHVPVDYLSSCGECPFDRSQRLCMLFTVFSSISMVKHLTVDHGSGSFASGLPTLQVPGPWGIGESWTDLLQEVVSHMGNVQHIRLHGSRCGGVLRFIVLRRPCGSRLITRAERRCTLAHRSRAHPSRYPGE